ncbi:MAG: nucleoside monophosphate kinase [Legionellaceae bacterium]|nr:nucleoside monophosphate kinase [Legionellaceae bacterium]
MKSILLIGAPGAGKGTQAQRLVEKYPEQFHPVNCGEIVRNFLKSPDHPVTIEYQDVIARGELLPDEVILSILKEHIFALEKSFRAKGQHKTLLIDGYPRTIPQYKDFIRQFGKPSGAVVLECDKQVLKERILTRNQFRSDDHEAALIRRFDDFEKDTVPLIEKIKEEKNTFCLLTTKAITETFPLFEQSVHEIMHSFSEVPWYTALQTMYQSGGNITDFTQSIRQKTGAHNFLVYLPFMSPVCFIEDKSTMIKVLNAPTALGDVYQQFSRAAGLTFDFTSLNASGENSIQWRCLHKAVFQVLQNKNETIQQLIVKHISMLLNTQHFQLDKNLDRFFDHFWCEFLTGNAEQVSAYHDLRMAVQKFMKRCFYENQWKSLDITGLSSVLYALPYYRELNELKLKMKKMIADSNHGLIDQLRSQLDQYNQSLNAGLGDEDLGKMLEDAVFNLLFIPDFLNGTIYQTLVYGLKNKVDFADPAACDQAYQAGLNQAYLFPYRSRTLCEPVTLPNGMILPKGTTAILQLKEAGLYHSCGPRMCPGINVVQSFKASFFKALALVELSLENVGGCAENLPFSGDENRPVDVNHYLLSWSLKRDALDKMLRSHPYQGLAFFDVLEAYEKPLLRKLVTSYITQRIEAILLENQLESSEVVIAAPEMRGIPLAAILADKLNVPLVSIRKAGGYKMERSDLVVQSYEKGYGQTDTLELPKTKQDVMQAKKIILIDDGIASGQSILACKKLVQSLGGNVVHIISMINHQYAQRAKAFDQHHAITTFFDCNPQHTNVIPIRKESSHHRHEEPAIENVAAFGR